MSFGIYVHIPYCVQRCHYCDFATYEQSQIMAPNKYLSLLKREIALRAKHLQDQTSYNQVDTLYFGGGTPSLFPAEMIVSLIDEIEKCGFKIKSDAEVTIEINPATMDKEKILKLRKRGVNRFSVGAQTFHPDFLKKLGRKHSVEDIHNTLRELSAESLNLSVDILFALPGQNLSQLQYDLEQVLRWNPQHISAYILTLQEGHFLNQNRPNDERQGEMFEFVSTTLDAAGYQQYEISNYSKPGLESRHNLIYWTDQQYLGFGSSAHSYLHQFDWGIRFWNPNSIGEYASQWEDTPGKFSGGDPTLGGHEILFEYQALTDLCHVSFRTSRGLLKEKVAIFSSILKERLSDRIVKLLRLQLIKTQPLGWTLTAQGKLLSNQVFSELTFLKEDMVP